MPIYVYKGPYIDLVPLVLENARDSEPDLKKHIDQIAKDLSRNVFLSKDRLKLDEFLNKRSDAKLYYTQGDFTAASLFMSYSNWKLKGKVPAKAFEFYGVKANQLEEGVVNAEDLNQPSSTKGFSFNYTDDNGISCGLSVGYLDLSESWPINIDCENYLENPEQPFIAAVYHKVPGDIKTCKVTFIISHEGLVLPNVFGEVLQPIEASARNILLESLHSKDISKLIQPIFAQDDSLINTLAFKHLCHRLNVYTQSNLDAKDLKIPYFAELLKIAVNISQLDKTTLQKLETIKQTANVEFEFFEPTNFEKQLLTLQLIVQDAEIWSTTSAADKELFLSILSYCKTINQNPNYRLPNLGLKEILASPLHKLEMQTTLENQITRFRYLLVALNSLVIIDPHLEQKEGEEIPKLQQSFIEEASWNQYATNGVALGTRVLGHVVNLASENAGYVPLLMSILKSIAFIYPTHAALALFVDVDDVMNKKELLKVVDIEASKDSKWNLLASDLKQLLYSFNFHQFKLEHQYHVWIQTLAPSQIELKNLLIRIHDVLSIYPLDYQGCYVLHTLFSGKQQEAMLWEQLAHFQFTPDLFTTPSIPDAEKIFALEKDLNEFGFKSQFEILCRQIISQEMKENLIQEAYSFWFQEIVIKLQSIAEKTKKYRHLFALAEEIKNFVNERPNKSNIEKDEYERAFLDKLTVLLSEFPLRDEERSLFVKPFEPNFLDQTILAKMKSIEVETVTREKKASLEINRNTLIQIIFGKIRLIMSGEEELNDEERTQIFSILRYCNNYIKQQSVSRIDLSEIGLEKLNPELDMLKSLSYRNDSFANVEDVLAHFDSIAIQDSLLEAKKQLKIAVSLQLTEYQEKSHDDMQVIAHISKALTHISSLLELDPKDDKYPDEALERIQTIWKIVAAPTNESLREAFKVIVLKIQENLIDHLLKRIQSLATLVDPLTPETIAMIEELRSFTRLIQNLDFNAQYETQIFYLECLNSIVTNDRHRLTALLDTSQIAISKENLQKQFTSLFHIVRDQKNKYAPAVEAYQEGIQQLKDNMSSLEFLKSDVPTLFTYIQECITKAELLSSNYGNLLLLIPIVSTLSLISPDRVKFSESIDNISEDVQHKCRALPDTEDWHPLKQNLLKINKKTLHAAEIALKEYDKGQIPNLLYLNSTSVNQSRVAFMHILQDIQKMLEQPVILHSQACGHLQNMIQSIKKIIQEDPRFSIQMLMQSLNKLGDMGESNDVTKFAYLRFLELQLCQIGGYDVKRGILLNDFNEKKADPETLKLLLLAKKWLEVFNKEGPSVAHSTLGAREHISRADMPLLYQLFEDISGGMSLKKIIMEQTVTLEKTLLKMPQTSLVFKDNLKALLIAIRQALPKIDNIVSALDEANDNDPLFSQISGQLNKALHLASKSSINAEEKANIAGLLDGDSFQYPELNEIENAKIQLIKKLRLSVFSDLIEELKKPFKNMPDALLILDTLLPMLPEAAFQKNVFMQMVQVIKSFQDEIEEKQGPKPSATKWTLNLFKSKPVAAAAAGAPRLSYKEECNMLEGLVSPEEGWARSVIEVFNILKLQTQAPLQSP